MLIVLGMASVSSHPRERQPLASLVVRVIPPSIVKVINFIVTDSISAEPRRTSPNLSHYSYLATHSLCISSPRYSTGI